MGNETQHTPGPWGLRQAPCGDVWAVTQQANDVIRVETKNAANARLIAAAPDLLAALQLICDSGVPLSAEIESRMLAAIGKTKGV